MGRARKLDHEFNKEMFIRLIEKAKGDKTQAEFANEAGISLANLSRILRGKLNTPPEIATIKKIASASHSVEVSYDLLINAAGFDIEKESINSTERLLRLKMYSEKCAEMFFKTNFRFESDDKILTFVSNKKGDSVTESISFIYPIDNLDNRATIKDIYYRLTTHEFNVNEKVVIVVDSYTLRDLIKNNPPVNLKMEVMIYCINSKEGSLINCF